MCDDLSIVKWEKNAANINLVYLLCVFLNILNILINVSITL